MVATYYIYTNYVITGPSRSLDYIDTILSNNEGIKSLLLRLLYDLNMSETYVDYLFGTDNIVIDWATRLHNTLRFGIIEERGNMSDFRVVLKRLVPRIKIYYETEDLQSKSYYTNDIKRKFFPYRYRLKCRPPETVYGVSKKFKSKRALLKYIRSYYCLDIEGIYKQYIIKDSKYFNKDKSKLLK